MIYLGGSIENEANLERGCLKLRVFYQVSIDGEEGHFWSGWLQLGIGPGPHISTKAKKSLRWHHIDHQLSVSKSIQLQSLKRGLDNDKNIYFDHAISESSR